MRVSELIQDLEIEARPGGAGDPEITSITEDSRQVAPGSLFVARPGTRSDGRRFITEALERGAAAILTDAGAPSFESTSPVLLSDDVPRAAAMLAERFFGEPSRLMDLVGVTGTNGKTTVAHLVRQALEAGRIRCGLIGTVGVDDGGGMCSATMTTPGAIELSDLLGRMRAAGCEAASLEVSSHALDQSRVAALRFRVGIFTNLSGDHLDYHGTMDAYAEAKAKLFASLAPDAIAVVNADDPAAGRMLRDCAAPAMLCSLDAESAANHPDRCFATDMQFTIDGLRAQFVGPWGVIDVGAPLVGRHNAMNLLQAVAACHALGLGRDELETAIGSVRTPAGRLEPVGSAPDAPRVFVDYAHTDDALIKTMDALRPLIPAGGRLIVVFGCGGDRDRTKRPRMGRAVAERADLAIITSDNPRTEDPRAIIDEVAAGVPDAQLAGLKRIVERDSAIHEAIIGAGSEDVVVIAGKGHEDYQILPDGAGGTSRRRFVDREVADQALRAHFGEWHPTPGAGALTP